MVQGLSDLLVLDEASIKGIETEEFPFRDETHPHRVPGPSGEGAMTHA
jgi:hypothetical protein